ncbi:MAG: hypothetical protein ABIS03_01785 [Gemmatimonadaceae bacterium]
MRHGTFRATLAATALGLAACSKSVAVEEAPRPTTLVSLPGERRWTTSIQPVDQSRFNAADSTRDRSHGSAQWSQGDRPTLSKVNLVFQYGGTERELSWAILFGSCGNASLPLIPMSAFPELDVSGAGRVQLNATLSLELATSGTFHIDIYKDRQGGAGSLVGCGNLKYLSR